jgi:DNA (cytosine-5)-methyltransferase 1
LLSHDQGRTFKIILSTLTELGYDIQAMVLNSKNFGVPQNRERVFIAGCLGGWGGKQVFSFGGANSKDIKEYKKVALNPSNYGTKGYIEGKNAIALSLPSGNNTTLIKQLNNPTHSNDRVYGADGVSLTLNTMQGGRRQPFVKIKEATKKGYVEAKEGDSINLSVPNSKTRRGRVGKGVAQTIDTGMQQYTLQEPKKELHAMRWQRTEKGKEARRESQKKGKDYTPFSDGHREVVPVEGKPVGALTAQAIAKDSLIGNKLQIRRLTPTECERLQGYPDGWTEGVSDTQRYKTLGNAVTVNVIREVMKNIL